MTDLDSLLTSRITGLDSVPKRELKHRRSFCFEVYEREDGLWDVDAQMQDHKTYPIELANEERAVGEPVHDMVMRVTFDTSLTIVDVQAKTIAAPYLPQCKQINPDYRNMIGLNVLKGFRAAMKERFADVAGCTHLTELAGTLPTVVIQGIGTELAARERRQALAHGGEHKKPFQLDKCHALACDGEAVRLYYPTWYLNELKK